MLTKQLRKTRRYNKHLTQQEDMRIRRPSRHATLTCSRHLTLILLTENGFVPAAGPGPIPQQI